MTLTRSAIISGSLLLSLLAGYAFARTEAYVDAYRGTFKVIVESGYNGGTDGIRFFALQRIDSKDVDRATLAIDADLPLGKAMLAVQGEKVRITIERVDDTLRVISR